MTTIAVRDGELNVFLEKVYSTQLDIADLPTTPHSPPRKTAT
jgi:hypothetical protein